MSKTYMVLLQAINSCAVTVEADSQSEAEQKAEDLEVHDIELDPIGWDMVVMDVAKVTER